MDAVIHVIDVALNLDAFLAGAAGRVGNWLYALLFAVVFCETGLVFTPFLPGDSLLFAAGTLAGVGILDPVLVAAVLLTAAVLGDAVNYAVGRHLGPRMGRGRIARLVPARHLERTRDFYARHGGKTVVLARFVPFVRTFAPFVAGISHMDPRRFFVFNVAGAALWVSCFVGAGYFFGRVQWVSDHLSIIVVATVALSLAPAVVSATVAWLGKRPSTDGELDSADE